MYRNLGEIDSNVFPGPKKNTYDFSLIVEVLTMNLSIVHLKEIC